MSNLLPELKLFPPSKISSMQYYTDEDMKKLEEEGWYWEHVIDLQDELILKEWEHVNKFCEDSFEVPKKVQAYVATQIAWFKTRFDIDSKFRNYNKELNKLESNISNAVDNLIKLIEQARDNYLYREPLVKEFLFPNWDILFMLDDDEIINLDFLPWSKNDKQKYAIKSSSKDNNKTDLIAALKLLKSVKPLSPPKFTKGKKSLNETNAFLKNICEALDPYFTRDANLEDKAQEIYDLLNSAGIRKPSSKSSCYSLTSIKRSIPKITPNKWVDDTNS